MRRRNRTNPCEQDGARGKGTRFTPVKARADMLPERERGRKADFSGTDVVLGINRRRKYKLREAARPLDFGVIEGQ